MLAQRDELLNKRTICFPVIFQYRTEEDHFKKEEKKAKLLKETIPFYLNKFEQTVAENSGYAVGSTVKRISVTIFTRRISVMICLIKCKLK